MKFFYGLKSKTYFQLPVCKDSIYVKSMSGQAASLPFSIAVVFLLDRMLVHHGVSINFAGTHFYSWAAGVMCLAVEGITMGFKRRFNIR